MAVRRVWVGAVTCVLLGWTAGLGAQGVRYDNIVLGPRGTPVGAATIAVCTSVAVTTATPCSPLAQIYSNEALTQAVANPFQADSLGNYGFWAPPGHYIVQIYGPGLTTKNMDVFVPCDPANCTASSATFSTLSVGTLNLTGSLTVNGRTVATEAAANDAVYYVSPNGNDANDGLSWGSSFQTLYHAVSVMEASAAQGGTLYVAANAACGGPVTGQGLWLYTTGSSPGSGWLQLSYPLRVVGVGVTAWTGQQPPSVVNLNCGSSTQIGLELDTTNRPVEFDNLGFKGSQALFIPTAVSAVFRNDAFNVDRTASTNGPAVLISSTGASNTFSIYFYDCLFQGNSPVASPGSDAAESFVVNPNGNVSDGLIFLQHSQFDSGDLKYYQGSTSGSLYVDGLLTEAQSDGHGAIWFPGGSGQVNGFFNATLANITVADAAGCVASASNDCYAVENDGPEGADSIVAWNLSGGSGLNAYGPMTVLGASDPADFANYPTLPLVQGNPGPYAGRSFWQQDSARRMFGPYASAFTNLDPQLPSSWSIGGSVTLANAPAPDGTNNAGLVTNSNNFVSGPAFHSASISLAAGDYLIGGFWAKGSLNYGGGQVINLGSCSTASLSQLASSLGTFPANGASSQEWEWYPAVYKVSGSGSCSVFHNPGVTNNSAAAFYAPVLFHVSSGTISDSEAALLALHLASYPDTLSPPVEATLRGHPFAFGGSGDNFFATLDHTALTANQTFTFPNASGTIELVLGGTAAGATSSLAANSCGDAVNATVIGAAASMVALASPQSAPSAGLTWYAFVSGANAVTIDYCNVTTSSITPAAVTWSVRVIQ